MTEQIVPEKLLDFVDDEWEILYIDPKELKGISPYNARKEEPEVDLDSLVISLKETGINTEPIIVDEDLYVISGGRRYRAALLANLPRVWCLKKRMSETEKIVRSFLENELKYDMTMEDRYQFAKTLRDKGMSVEEIALITGRSPSTIREWLGLHKVPDVLKETEVEEEYKQLPIKKKQLLRSSLQTLDVFRDNPEAAVKAVKLAKKAPLRVVEEIIQDAKSGHLEVNPTEKLEKYEQIAEELKKPKKERKYFLRPIRLPQDLVKKLVMVAKFDFPNDTLDDIVAQILWEYVNRRSKELGLMF